MPVLVDGTTPPAAAGIELHPLAARALERLEPYWPGLGASVTA
jgi:hypothetical protein